MDLRKLYFEVKDHIDKIDFSTLWKGFEPLKYALYDDTSCFLNGEYIEKTADFLANTSVLFNSEYIAIWKITDDIDPEILASKIIHEMFHAFQEISRETRFPDELASLKNYNYSAHNLSIKLEENKLIVKLLEHFDSKKFEQLRSLRKFRMIKHEYEYKYEAAVEQIEGTATYVELGALEQISKEKHQKVLSEMIDNIQDPIKMIPVRVLSYSVGALFFKLLKENDKMNFDVFSDKLTTVSILDHVQAFDGTVQICAKIQEAVDAYFRETDEIIQKAEADNCCVTEGEFDLLGVNVYNARYRNGYITTTYFVAYAGEGEQTVLHGDFVIKLNEKGKVTKILKIHHSVQ